MKLIILLRTCIIILLFVFGLALALLILQTGSRLFQNINAIDTGIVVINSDDEDETRMLLRSSHKIVNFSGFEYQIKNDICHSVDEKLLGILIITSYVGHDDLRSAHRKAISQQKLRKMGFLRVFVIAKIPDHEKFINQFQIGDEHRRYGDLLQGNFYEAYRNLTFKHIMGLKWASTSCANAKFIIKLDDDTVFDVFHLKNYLENFAFNSSNTYPLSRFVAGYVLERMKPIREPANKWFVTQEEFDQKIYPDYVSGWFYITNPKSARDLVYLSQELGTRFFWIDDTFVTGILRDKLDIPLVKLNDWYSVNSEVLYCCIRHMKEKSLKCDLYAGPNGGDSKLIIDFINSVEKCYSGHCISRAAGQSLKQTCVAERKRLMPQNHGKPIVRAIQLK